jgi:hypothetical protein
MVYTLHELFAAHFGNPAKMSVAHCTDNGIDFSNLSVHRTHAFLVFDINLNIATGSADGNNFMSITQRVNSALSYRPICADYDDFHFSSPRLF